MLSKMAIYYLQIHQNDIYCRKRVKKRDTLKQIVHS